MELKETFDTAAEEYERYRHGHADAVFDLVAAEVPPPARVLEVGCGPGQATVPLAERGYVIHAIELGAKLAERARARVEGFPNVRIEVGAFEDFELAPSSADLVVCASSFHWLDSARALPKMHHALDRGGGLALFWSAEGLAEDWTGLRAALKPVYEKHAPSKPPSVKEPAQWLAELTEALTQVGFEGLRRERIPWELHYDTAGYLKLLGTYSANLALPDDRREALFRDLAEIVDREFGGSITVPQETQLYFARKA